MTTRMPWVEAIAPKDYLGDLVGDLNSRLCTLLGIEAEGDAFTVSACVPAAQMSGFEYALAQITHARASYSVLFSHYEEVPSPPSDDSPSPEPAVAALRA